VTNFVEGKTRAMARTSPSEFFNQVKAEARKVVWPTRQETVTTAIFVGVMMLILSIFFLGIDTLFGYAVRLLLQLA
jgi:preprotein translocase subunit SecE